ncbi:hypothetical protein [Streptomyces noursei]|uniref:hypothetical protein n=1 Tax=Streptomyces noursei TaxID=1971 RepID=UPI0023B867EE|nr:hypothetical protein [Streptomyces noursei]
MTAHVERGNALDAEHGELQRLPRGTAISSYIGKKATRKYLAHAERDRIDLVA